MTDRMESGTSGDNSAEPTKGLKTADGSQDCSCAEARAHLEALPPRRRRDPPAGDPALAVRRAGPSRAARPGPGAPVDPARHRGERDDDVDHDPDPGLRLRAGRARRGVPGRVLPDRPLRERLRKAARPCRLRGALTCGRLHRLVSGARLAQARRRVRESAAFRAPSWGESRHEEAVMSKRGRKRRARAKSSANHGKRPNA